MNIENKLKEFYSVASVKFKNAFTFLEGVILIRMSRAFYYFVMLVLVLGLNQIFEGFFLTLFVVIIFIAIFFFDQKLVKERVKPKDE